MVWRRLLMVFALFWSVSCSSQPVDNARVFDRVWSLVGRRYWDHAFILRQWQNARERFRPAALAVDSTPALYRVLGQMLDLLHDSHAYVVDPERVRIERARARGAADVSFGFTTDLGRDGRLMVSAVDAGSAAEREGVQIGWSLERVDGRRIDVDFVAMDGRTAILDFVDEKGRPHQLNLVASVVPPRPAQQATRRSGGVLLLRMDVFETGTDHWLRRQIATASAGLILDLRGNDGGEAGTVARVAGFLFGERRPMLIEVGARSTLRYTVAAGRNAYLGPLAILIGPNSASGAEVIAAIVQESRRGMVLGETSAGALTSAAEYRLPDGGLLSLAEADVRTPAGRRIEGVGVTPDRTVTPTLAERRARQDPVVACAEALLLGHTAGSRCGAASPPG